MLPFNLNIPRYIDGSDPEDLQDIEAHLKGGVPNRDIDLLAEFWDVMPGIRATLFGPEPLRCSYTFPIIRQRETALAVRRHNFLELRQGHCMPLPFHRTQKECRICPASIIQLNADFFQMHAGTQR